MTRHLSKFDRFWTLPLILLCAVSIVFVWSATGPSDLLTWFLDVVPFMVALPFLFLTARRFPLTHIAYVLIAVHAMVLMIGGRYTYAKVPAGFWVQEAMGLTRNPYDRLGHFIQGFVPAIIDREILIRKSPLRSGRWLFFLVTCVCLAISAFYEFIEWWVAVAQGGAADAFLGTQGDVWDTQWDMFCAFIGAICAQILFGKWHDRQLAKLRIK